MFRSACSLMLLMIALTAAPVFPQTSKADDVIYDKVRLKLAGDPDVKGGALDVQVKDGAVTLSGIVRTDRAKAKAEKLASKVKGVTHVTNEIKVAPTGN